MPRSSTGKWVARAGATGGGRTYRGQMPVNFYAALVIIVILGLVSLVFARSSYQHGTVASTTPPTKGTTWYAAFDFDICGTQLPPVASNLTSASTQSIYTPGTGVIVISPKSTADAGTNAVLAKFVSGYPGMALTATSVTVPPKTPATTSSTTTTAPKAKSSSKSSKKSSHATKASAPVTYRNGHVCPAGTKDAGKRANVVVSYWANAFAANGKPQTVTGPPGTLRFSDNQLITIGVVPPGTKLPKPPGSVVTALLRASTAGTSTTTTLPATSTTAPATSTTAPATSTTAPATSTTAPATSTTAPATSTTAPATTTTTSKG